MLQIVSSVEQVEWLHCHLASQFLSVLKMQHLAWNRVSFRNTFKFTIHSATSAQTSHLFMAHPGERERQRLRERVGGGLPYIMSGVLTGAPPSHCLLNLHNQVCCFRPCFQLSCTEGNLLALIWESLEITLHDESSEWFSWMLFNELLNLHCHCNKSRCPMQLAKKHCAHNNGRESGWYECILEEFKEPNNKGNMYSGYILYKITTVIFWRKNRCY